VTTIAAGVDLDLVITGKIPRKGISKLARHRVPLDVVLYQDDLRDQARRLSYDTGSGMTPVDGAMLNAGDSKWKNARAGGHLRRIRWAARF
jgi:hypothetical protein